MGAGSKEDLLLSIYDKFQFYEDNVFPLEVGSIIKLNEKDVQHETIMLNLARYVEQSVTVSAFEIYPIVPGSELFTIWGDSHYVVIKNE